MEAVIVVSVLLAFVKQSMGSSANGPELKKKLYRQIWLGAGLGVLICIIIGGAFIGTFTGWVKISGENQKTCGKGYFVSLPQS